MHLQKREPRGNRGRWGWRSWQGVACCIQALFELIFTAMEGYLRALMEGVT